MNQKFVVFLLIAFALLTPAAAQYQTGTDSDGFMHFPSYQYPYGSDATTFSPYCDRSETDVCPTGASATGDDGVVISMCDGTQVAPNTRPTEERLYYEWTLAPRALLINCNIGSTQDYIQLENANNGNQWSGGEIMFYPQTSGSYLHVGMNYDNDALRQFHLKSTDSTPNSNLKNNADQGDVLVTEHNPNLFDGNTHSRAYESKTGVILQPFGSGTLSAIMEDCDSSDKTCKTAEDLSFGTDYDTSNCYGECGLGYNDNGIIDYEPDMEIIAGEGFTDTPPTSLSYKRFYICDEALAGTNGQKVYSPGDIHQSDYFECNLGDWVEIDPNNNCEDPVIGDVTIYDPAGVSMDTPAAFWGHNPTGEYVDQTTDCHYDNAQPDSWTEYSDELGHSAAPFDGDSEPVVFQCVNGTTNTLQDYPDIDNYSGIAADYMRDAENSAENYCEQRANWDFETVGETMPMVQYYIPIENLPQDYGDGGSFVSTSGNYLGVENYKFDDLYRAMATYNNIGNEWDCTDCREEETWTALNMTNTAGYAANEPENFIDAWNVTNVGGNPEKRVRQSENFEVNSNGEPKSFDEDVFPGGFAGACPEGRVWQFDQDEAQWLCSDAVPYTQEIFVPTFDYPTSQDMVTVGFHFMPTLYNTNELFQPDQPYESFSQVVQGSYGVDQHLEEFESVCWWGGSDRYSELKEENRGQTWFSIEYTNMPESPENPVPVFGQLNKTIKQDRGWGGPTCRWVHHANQDYYDYEKLVYRFTGTVKPVTNINTVADDRNFTSDSIDLADDYTTRMSSNLFATVSQEWQNEAGYSRNELPCVPNDKHFDGTGMACD